MSSHYNIQRRQDGRYVVWLWAYDPSLTPKRSAANKWDRPYMVSSWFAAHVAHTKDEAIQYIKDNPVHANYEVQPWRPSNESQ